MSNVNGPICIGTLVLYIFVGLVLCFVCVFLRVPMGLCSSGCEVICIRVEIVGVDVYILSQLYTYWFCVNLRDGCLALGFFLIFSVCNIWNYFLLTILK